MQNYNVVNRLYKQADEIADSYHQLPLDASDKRLEASDKWHKKIGEIAWFLRVYGKKSE